MRNKVAEGEIFKVSGGDLEYGDSLKVVSADGAMEFKDEIVIVGKGGFKAYPSEELFIGISKLLEGHKLPMGVITEIKKEGTYCALFRVD